MLRFISLPFNRIKYHSSRGLHPMSLCACLFVSLFVYMCVTFLSVRVCVCACQGVVRLVRVVPGGGYGFCLCYCEDTPPYCLLVFAPQPTPPPSCPPARACTPGHMGAVGGLTSHHFLWLTVGADQGATRV